MTDSPLTFRSRTLAAASDERFDLLVIGGGITGAGVARDAALRGLRVVLVERDDLAAGTSSRSSRLVHGGVRYLEHGHLGLVFEASRERRILLRTAPHLVRPLAFTWPVYQDARVPRWKLRAGLALYDTLALFRNVGVHHALTADGVLEREPHLAREGLVGGATYWDAGTDDARLTVATALGAYDAGAVLLTHAEVRGIAFEDGGAVVHVHDVLALGEYTLRARVVVNAAGPWGDVVQRLAEPAAPHALLGAKGVHVSVPAERVGNRGAVTLLSPIDGRVMFVLRAGAVTVIGTTETPAEHGPDAVVASEADVVYLLRSANAFFPEAHLRPDDVITAWAGVRPLAVARTAHGATSTASASREHTIVRDARGLVSVSGGKLTTYRAMAAQVVDAAVAVAGMRVGRAPTDTTPLPGGEGDPRTLVDEATHATGDAAIARRLVEAHGARWRSVWAWTDIDRALGVRVVPELPYVRAEIVHAVEAELALTLADVLVRRVPIAFETRDQGRMAAREIAPLVAARLGRPDDVAALVADYDRAADALFRIEPG